MSDRTLTDVLTALAARTETVLADAGDEHHRYWLYLEAAEDDGCHADLLEAVSLEPDTHVGLSIALRLLELVPASQRPQWVCGLPSDYARQYAEQRANDLGLLEHGNLTDRLQDGTVDGWSGWLQVRLAVASKEPAVLTRLAAEGRTKRVRHTAAQTLRSLTG